MGSEDKTSEESGPQEISNKEQEKSNKNNEELSDKEVREYFLTDPNEVEANIEFGKIQEDPNYVGDFDTYFDSDGEDPEPKPTDGFYKEGPFPEPKPPPNYFERTVKDEGLHYVSENDDSVDPMEVEEAQRVRDPNYLKTIDLDNDNEDFDLDKVDFSQFPDVKKKKPEEFVIQSGRVPDKIIEDFRAIPIDIVTREEWGALPRPQVEDPLKAPVLYIHMEYYTPVEACFTKEDCIKAAREIQRNHMEERGLPDIAHNFLIGGDGNVYEGRGWNVKAEKSDELPKYSGKYLEFAYIGDYREQGPTEPYIDGQWGLLGEGMEFGHVDDDFDFI